MTHVVTRSCCADASCVFACPVNAIHPNPHDPSFATAEMLYIDPATCVDCGACIDACPVGAITPAGKLTPQQRPFLDINALYHRSPAPRPVQAPVPPLVKKDPARGPLRVAVVGSGPAGLYTADALLEQPGVEVTVLDRLPTPYGLVRSGVAPDHPDTKAVTHLFRQVEGRAGFRYVLGVEVGAQLTHQDLLDHHHAVVYATGASRDRRLGIAGEDLPGSGTATDFVAWYNGHPDATGQHFDLAHERAVIVGNGNVALDVARILTTDPETLARTDIADSALAALRESSIREVVVLARRGPAQAAYTLPELTALLTRDDLEVVVDNDDGSPYDGTDLGVAQKVAAVRALPRADAPPSGRRRIVLRFWTTPVAVLGDHAARGVQVAQTVPARDDDGTVRAVPTDRTGTLEAGLVLRSIGYRGVPVPGLPFEESLGVVPHDGAGRVDGVPRSYVVGWIKRGPTGFIGTNKSCALETVNALLRDVNAGLLPPPPRRTGGFSRLLAERCPQACDLDGWRRIDAAERTRGVATGRPRVKITDLGELAAVAAGGRQPLVSRWKRSTASWALPPIS